MSEEFPVHLTGTHNQRAPLNAVAEELLKLESQSLAGPDDRPWIQHVAEKSGYSMNQLRRMTRVIQYVHRLVGEGHLESSDIIKSMPFAYMETAMRIYNFSPETGLSILRGEWIKPKYADLLAEYHRVKENAPKSYSPMIAGKRAVRQFQDAALSILNTAEFLHLGPDRQISRMINPSRYANPDFLIVSREDGAVISVDGIDCYALFGKSQREYVIKRALHAAVESTFFKSFWVVLPDPENAYWFQVEAQRLSLGNVGTITIDVSKREITDYIEPIGPAVIDRTELWKKHMPSKMP